MRSALFLPIFDELSDARVVADLAVEAEAAGWHGVFVWDHIAYRAPVRAVADPWVVLSAVAVATERVLIGPMVTPLARRRPVKLAREVATLDRLSAGRLVLGVGLGGDGSRELSATGEQTDDRVRAAMLDESLEVLRACWTGGPVQHRGEHYVVDDLTVLPTPLTRPGADRPGPPVWVAARRGNRAPLRRAARHDGAFPIDVESPDQLAEIAAELRELRAGDDRPFDLVVGGPPGTDPTPYAAAGATWWTVSFPIGTTVAEVRATLQDGPVEV